MTWRRTCTYTVREMRSFDSHMYIHTTVCIPGYNIWRIHIPHIHSIWMHIKTPTGVTHERASPPALHANCNRYLSHSYTHTYTHARSPVHTCTQIDGNVYTQSLAIARFVGKLSGLYPSDPLQALRCDEVMDALHGSTILSVYMRTRVCVRERERERKRKRNEHLDECSLHRFPSLHGTRTHGHTQICSIRLWSWNSKLPRTQSQLPLRKRLPPVVNTWPPSMGSTLFWKKTAETEQSGSQGPKFRRSTYAFVT